MIEDLQAADTRERIVLRLDEVDLLGLEAAERVNALIAPQLSDYNKNRKVDLYIDFSAVELLGPETIGKLIQAQKLATQLNIRLCLIGLSPHIYGVFPMTGLLKHFDLVEMKQEEQ